MIETAESRISAALVSLVSEVSENPLYLYAALFPSSSRAPALRFSERYLN